MINTYEAYLKHPAGNILTVEDALRIYGKLAKCIEQCTLEDKMEFWQDLLKRAAEYSRIRNGWETMSREEKMDADEGRTLSHDGVITALNVLSRIAEKEQVDNSWRSELGEERKRIGDFACFIAYITGISNR
ncbi:MAG: hypothetical protein K5985_12060 [Lachnospiraceae bacterium]|nr:hypothetical protein [Lachnospiraceae bacterium]